MTSKLTLARKAAGFTSAESLATKVGVSAYYLHEIERGAARPSGRLAGRLATQLHLTAEEVIVLSRLAQRALRRRLG